MITHEILIKLIRIATQAPSGHNSQPWKFSIRDEKIIIQPDFQKSLPIVDPDNHALYISLGCALKNIEIAAMYYGYKPAYVLHKDQTRTWIELSFNPDHRSGGELYHYISKRQSNKGRFRNKTIPDVQLEELRLLSGTGKTGIYVFTGEKDKNKIIEMILEGTKLQFSNPRFRKELLEWIRFSQKDAMKTGDGLWSACSGLPSPGKSLGQFLFRNFVHARSEVKRLEKLLSNTPAFVVFTASPSCPDKWIELGRCFQEFGLRATRLEIALSHLNMPCEEPSVRRELIKMIRCGDETPLLLIRMGYADPMPYSMRRSLDAVIINKE